MEGLVLVWHMCHRIAAVYASTLRCIVSTLFCQNLFRLKTGDGPMVFIFCIPIMVAVASCQESPSLCRASHIIMSTTHHQAAVRCKSAHACQCKDAHAHCKICLQGGLEYSPAFWCFAGCHVLLNSTLRRLAESVRLGSVLGNVAST